VVTLDKPEASTNTKVTLNLYIPQDLKNRLHKYVYETWPGEPHGKLRQLVIEALEEKLAREEGKKDRARKPKPNRQG